MDQARSEHELTAAAVAGDAAALGLLLETHQDRIYNVCLRMLNQRDDAAEVAQDVMVKVIQHLHDFKQDAAFATWVTRIAMNLSISQLRKRKLRRTVSLDGSGAGNGQGAGPGYSGSVSGGASGASGVSGGDQAGALRERLADGREPSPPASVQDREMIQRLHLALASLDEEFRGVLVLRDLEQMDYQAMAAVLGVPLGTVKSRLFRARLALREKMDELEKQGPAARVQHDLRLRNERGKVRSD
jgi:RNA polymerase sigma-70 factor (ECF subfamily)